MSCKSLLYAVNSSPQAMEENGVINFGQIVRRFGRNVNLVNGNAVLQGAGYYKISVNFVLTGAGTGPVVIQLYKNGVAIEGATDSRTLAVGNVNTLSMPAVVVRDLCCVESVITAVITGDASTINTAAITVEKL